MLRLSITVCLLAALSVMAGCASFNQTIDDVYRRESGSTLKPWKTLSEAANAHWPYAWASVSAYLHNVDDKDIEVTETCPEPSRFLNEQKWQLWTELPRVGRKSIPNNDLEVKLQQAHLRVEVWSNQEANTVIVAFGGTASMKDIGANLRWFLPFGEPDAYDVLTDYYVPAFVEAYKFRSNQPVGNWLRNAQIISTGHSLGGGLAQRFAYSLISTQSNPRVNEVYAFNPSPVSGKRSTSNFADQAKELTIYRIYNRGEILAGVRSILQWFNLGNKRNEGQTFVDIRYAKNWSWRTLFPLGWIKAHRMHELACFMKDQLQTSAGSP